MKTTFNTYTNRALFGLSVLFVVAAMPVQAADFPRGAKCVNGVVVVPRHGPPGKEPHWIPMQKKCEIADFAAMETQAHAKEDRTRTGVQGKPGYDWQPARVK